MINLLEYNQDMLLWELNWKIKVLRKETGAVATVMGYPGSFWKNEIHKKSKM